MISTANNSNAVILSDKTTKESKSANSECNDDSEQNTDKEVNEDRNTSEGPTSTYIPNFSSNLKSLFARLQERQNSVDSGTYIKKGPGRNRKNPYKTTFEISSIIESYLQGKLSSLVRNRR